jgi:F0F1-type ATP synthase assembly protein I
MSDPGGAFVAIAIRALLLLNSDMPTDDDNNDGGISWRAATATVGLALAIPSMLFVPALVGYWIDSKYGTGPLWLIVGLVIGLIGTAFDVYRLLQRLGQLK